MGKLRPASLVFQRGSYVICPVTEDLGFPFIITTAENKLLPYAIQIWIHGCFIRRVLSRTSSINLRVNDLDLEVVHRKVIRMLSVDTRRLTVQSFMIA